MMHGPCGVDNCRSPCMKNNKCSKHFPKSFFQETTIDNDGFPNYRRRNNGRTVEKNGVLLDNRFVIPYNIDLLVKYPAHMNVEWCNRFRSIKYLFKYINKGSDRATMVLEDTTNTNDGNEFGVVIDETKAYLDCRYISASKACWRTFEFNIQFRSPAVERLNFHLDKQHSVTFQESNRLHNVSRRPGIENTMFTEWMQANNDYEDARELTYTDFPTKWVWHNNVKEWKRRKSGKCIGRIYFAHPSNGENYYLRMLLNIVKGPRNFKEIRTINGVTFETFQEACYALGLLDNDKEWNDAILEASYWASGRQLCELFVTILMFCEVGNPCQIWDSYWKLLSEDINHIQRRILQFDGLQLSETQLKNHALYEIEKLLQRFGKSLGDYAQMPLPDMSLLPKNTNRLIQEEMSYDILALRKEHEILLDGLNHEQKNIYASIMQAIATDSGGYFFVYGHGGTGKTHLYKTILAGVRSQGKIALATASSRIAALLVPGGRTAHSRFHIPININDESTCEIKQQTQVAELLLKTSVILWDEALMAHRNCLEAVDRSLRDILQIQDAESVNKPFGGKVVVLVGDFRQILPVVRKGRRADIVYSTINRSYLWRECLVFKLNTNMRLLHNKLTTSEYVSMKKFSEWILEIGNGELGGGDGRS